MKQQITVRIDTDDIAIAKLITRIWGQNHELPQRWGVTKVYRMALSEGLKILLEKAQDK